MVLQSLQRAQGGLQEARVISSALAGNAEWSFRTYTISQVSPLPPSLGAPAQAVSVYPVAFVSDFFASWSVKTRFSFKVSRAPQQSHRVPAQRVGPHSLLYGAGWERGKDAELIKIAVKASSRETSTIEPALSSVRYCNPFFGWSTTTSTLFNQQKMNSKTSSQTCLWMTCVVELQLEPHAGFQLDQVYDLAAVSKHIGSLGGGEHLGTLYTLQKELGLEVRVHNLNSSFFSLAHVLD